MKTIKVKIADSKESTACEYVRLPASAYETSGRLELFAPDGYLFDDDLSSLICFNMADLRERAKDTELCKQS